MTEQRDKSSVSNKKHLFYVPDISANILWRQGPQQIDFMSHREDARIAQMLRRAQARLLHIAVVLSVLAGKPQQIISSNAKTCHENMVFV
jgi:hypothetical protein